jgi:hypothetical protein
MLTLPHGAGLWIAADRGLGGPLIGVFLLYTCSACSASMGYAE